MRLRRDELDDPGGQALEPHCADSALGGAVVVHKDESGLRRDPEFSPHRDDQGPRCVRSRRLLVT